MEVGPCAPGAEFPEPTEPAITGPSLTWPCAPAAPEAGLAYSGLSPLRASQQSLLLPAPNLTLLSPTRKVGHGWRQQRGRPGKAGTSWGVKIDKERVPLGIPHTCLNSIFNKFIKLIVIKILRASEHSTCL